MAARMVNAIPTANANLAGFGFGAMFPSWLTLLVPVPGGIGLLRLRCLNSPSLPARKRHESVPVWHLDPWQYLGIDRLVLADDAVELQ